MFTKTTLNKADNQNAENVSQRNVASNGKILPAVSPLQQKSIDSKAEPVQRVEEEEPMQGKFDPIQKMEEEEPVQGKFEPIQKMEEEEPMQGKFEPIQKMEEEEPLQGKFATIQRYEGQEDVEDDTGMAQMKKAPIQKKTNQTTQLEDGQASAAPKNKTGLPDNLKSGIENISGMAMDDVKVHYNSDKPAQLNALAYAQGTDIHVASGQEKHLPHEAWHVVQQKQGRVKPTLQMKQGVPVNDDAGLENEADVMGAQAQQKGGEITQQKSIQKKKSSGLGVVQGFFGKDYDYVKGENPELNPGMSMMKGGYQLGGLGIEGAKGSLGLAKSGIKGSAGLAMSGMSKSASLAAAPAMWAKEKMGKTDSKLKKFGYGALGAFGSLFSGAAGLVGGIGSAVAGGVGMLGSAALGGAGAVGSAVGGGALGLSAAAAGGVTTGLGGIVTGGKKLKEKISGVNVQNELGNYSPGAKGALGDQGTGAAIGEFNPDGTRVNYGKTTGADLAGYSMTGISAAASAGRSLTDYSNQMANGAVPLVNGKSIADAGFKANLGGAADAFGSLGAISGIVGTGVSLKDSYDAMKDAKDNSMRTGERVAAGGKAMSSLAEGTKASASAAWNIASLVDAKGAAAAGAQIAAGGAGIAMGAIDMIRGGYGIYKASDRIKVLEGIEKTSNDSEVKKIAKDVIETQQRSKKESITNVAKGAITIAGGALLVASMATPIGWALMGGAALVGGIYALYNYLQKKKSKKAVAMRELGVEIQRDVWKMANKDRIAKIENETGYFSKERKERLAKNEEEYPDPLKLALKENGFVDVGHFYSNYINATANQIYQKGVVNAPSNENGGLDLAAAGMGGNNDEVKHYQNLLNGMGLTVNTTDPKNLQPTPAKIAKALSK